MSRQSLIDAGLAKDGDILAAIDKPGGGEAALTARPLKHDGGAPVTDQLPATAAPGNQPDNLLAVIERAVMNPDIDVDKMERLLAMKERVDAENAKRAFYEAFRAAKAEMPAVVKNSDNSQTNSRYANLEAVSDAMDPVIHRHGFALSFGTGDSGKEGFYRVTCRLMHVDGHAEDYFADVPADNVGIKGSVNKTATHGFGSTMSYGRRYLKMMVFDVATTDDDGQAAGRREQHYERISPEQCGELRRLIAAADTTEEKFAAIGKLDSIVDMAAKDFESAKAMLMKRIDAKRGEDAK